MGGPDNARLMIRQQNRPTIGGEDAEQQAGPVRHQSIGMGPRTIGPGICRHNGLSRMDLMERHQLRTRQNSRHRPAAVFVHGFAVIGRPETDIQPAVDAGGYAALSPEKGVGQGFKRRGADRDNFCGHCSSIRMVKIMHRLRHRL
jgi:hypothetical protein